MLWARKRGFGGCRGADALCFARGRLAPSLRMQKLTENYVVSNAKIKAALGMKEMPVRAKDGLRETIKSFAGK